MQECFSSFRVIEGATHECQWPCREGIWKIDLIQKRLKSFKGPTKVFFLHNSCFLFPNGPAYLGNSTKKCPQKYSVEERLQINKHMRLRPAGFVALFTKSWIMMFHRQQEPHILNSNRKLISNEKGESKLRMNNDQNPSASKLRIVAFLSLFVWQVSPLSCC